MTPPKTSTPTLEQFSPGQISTDTSIHVNKNSDRPLSYSLSLIFGLGACIDASLPRNSPRQGAKENGKPSTPFVNRRWLIHFVHPDKLNRASEKAANTRGRMLCRCGHRPKPLAGYFICWMGAGISLTPDQSHSPGAIAYFFF